MFRLHITTKRGGTWSVNLNNFDEWEPLNDPVHNPSPTSAKPKNKNQFEVLCETETVSLEVSRFVFVVGSFYSKSKNILKQKGLLELF